MYTSSRSHSFLLLEVLIALLLVVLCAVPLMRLPLLHFRKQVETLSEFERCRIADWTYSEIKERLLKTEIPWEQLPKQGEVSQPEVLPPMNCSLPPLLSRSTSRSFSMKCTSEKEGIKGEIYRLYDVSLSIDAKQVDPPYRLLVTKNPPQTESAGIP